MNKRKRGLGSHICILQKLWNWGSWVCFWISRRCLTAQKYWQGKLKGNTNRKLLLILTKEKVPPWDILVSRTEMQVAYKHLFRGLKGRVLLAALYSAAEQSNLFFLQPAFAKIAVTVNLSGLKAPAGAVVSHNCSCIQITIISLMKVMMKVTFSSAGTGAAMLCKTFLCWQGQTSWAEHWEVCAAQGHAGWAVREEAGAELGSGFGPISFPCRRHRGCHVAGHFLSVGAAAGCCLGGALGSGNSDGRVLSRLENTFFPLDSLTEISMSDKISKINVELVRIIKGAFIIRKEEQNKGKDSVKRKWPPPQWQWAAASSWAHLCLTACPSLQPRSDLASARFPESARICSLISHAHRHLCRDAFCWEGNPTRVSTGYLFT